MSLAALYERATEFGEPLRCAETILAVVAELEQLVSAYPLFAFAELVAGFGDGGAATQLRRWVDDNLELVREARRGDLASLRADCISRRVVLGDRTHLLVRLHPEEPGGSAYQVQCWLFPSGSRHAVNRQPDGPLSLDAAQAWFTGLVDEYGAGVLAESQRPIVEFVLQPGRLHERVDAWPVPGPDGDPIPAGTRYVVVVRPDGRPSPERWRRRWDMLTERREADADTMARWISQSAAENPAGLYEDDTWVLMAVTCPAASASAGAIGPLLEAGTPVAVWIRDSRDPAVARTVLEDLLSRREIRRLPDRVRGARQQGYDTPGDRVLRDVVLLWDDPTRPPPEPVAWGAPAMRTG